MSVTAAATTIYNNHIYNSRLGFVCPECNQPVEQLKWGEKHLGNCYQLNPTLCCVWCRGAVSWPSRQKTRHATHLLDCHLAFMSQVKTFPSAGNVLQKKYLQVVADCHIKIICARCSEEVAANSMEGHARAFHQFDTLTRCTWCWGAYSWERGQKHCHVPHLLSCFKKAVHPTSAQPPAIHAQFAYRLKPIFFGMNGNARILGDWAYQEILPYGPIQIITENKITFSDANTQTACDCVKLYASGRHTFYHIMVRAVALQTFARLMEGICRTLPFWCWCNGGPNLDPMIRQHRHMIAVTDDPNGFSRVWEKVKRECSTLPANVYAVYKKEFESVLHFINTIGYLSKLESQCRVSGDSHTMENHFSPSLPLPRSFYKCAAGLYPGVFLEMIRRRYQNKVLSDVHDKACKDGNFWVLKIGDLPGLQMHEVLPVSRGWRPVLDLTTDTWLELYDGKRLYFIWDEEMKKRNLEEWIQNQGVLGNCFYHCIREKFYPYSNMQKHRIEEHIDTRKRVFAELEADADEASRYPNGYFKRKYEEECKKAEKREKKYKMLLLEKRAKKAKRKS